MKEPIPYKLSNPRIKLTFDPIKVSSPEELAQMLRAEMEEAIELASFDHGNNPFLFLIPLLSAIREQKSKMVRRQQAYEERKKIMEGMK